MSAYGGKSTPFGGKRPRLFCESGHDRIEAGGFVEEERVAGFIEELNLRKAGPFSKQRLALFLITRPDSVENRDRLRKESIAPILTRVGFAKQLPSGLLWHLERGCIDGVKKRIREWFFRKTEGEISQVGASIPRARAARAALA